MSGKILIAIMSCHRDRALHHACRSTWLRPFTGERKEDFEIRERVDYVFFLGRNETGHTHRYLDDELILESGDDYTHVTEKSRALFSWALDHSYSHVLHCGRDTYVHVQRIINAIYGLEAGLVSVDYAGNCGCCAEAHFTSKVPDEHGRFAYGSGGAGSWLSAEAMRVILDSPLYHEADDLLYGWVLGRAGIVCWHDPRFQRRGEYLEPGNVTVHLSRGTGNYHSRWMRTCHEQTLAEETKLLESGT